MAGEKLNSIGDFERFVEAKIEPWSSEQRLALAAAMAERWLPFYEAFSEREQWGDPANLRRLREALAELKAEVIAVPPLLARHLRRGHAVNVPLGDG